MLSILSMKMNLTSVRDRQKTGDFPAVQVSRMFSLGRKRGYVRIQMFPPDYEETEFVELEHRLENEFGCWRR